MKVLIVQLLDHYRKNGYRSEGIHLTQDEWIAVICLVVGFSALAIAIWTTCNNSEDDW